MRKRITVNGIVQGVGFRPFVYRIAVRNSLKGSVKNLGDAGVEIIVDGTEADIKHFLRDLEQRKPPLSEIDTLKAVSIEQDGLFTKFEILKSDSGGQGSGTIPPDTATCDECLADVKNQTRYHGYWATSCVNCGPRFTVIRELPYDRERTSMDEFPMCGDCGKEYTAPLDRRYHAQTIACERCGPKLFFHWSVSAFERSEHRAKRRAKSSADPIKEAAKALREGMMVAIKGIGGTHLACDATCEEVVSGMRRRLGRPAQPFALMATEEMLSKIAKVSRGELEMMRTLRRPITILAKQEGSPLAPSVSPGLHNVGIMLPYSALHHLLFDHIGFPLVMTSANMPGEPMLIDNEEIKRWLKGVADGFLLHNREIVSRCDDSVVRYSGGGWRFLRRSRGWVPAPIEIELDSEPILALGPELDTTIALYVDGKCYISQYIGDIDDVETFEYLKGTIEHMLKITGTKLPKHIACDLHPQFMTTKLAKELGERVTQVQHHHAHIAKVLGEHGLERTVGIALDGIGYGADSSIWGGEVLLSSKAEYGRVGGLSRVPMPGGDLATKYPARMVAGILYAGGLRGAELHNVLKKHAEFRGGSREMEAVIKQLQSGINTVDASSAGRFLDAVSTLLNICSERTYEGEPAMKLESAAVAGDPIDISLEFKHEEGRKVLDVPALFKRLIELKDSHPVADIAATAELSLAKGVAGIAIEVAREEGVNNICLSGGVAYNDMITRIIKEEVERAGLHFYTNEKLPCGDGGISFGQVIVAGSESHSP